MNLLSIFSKKPTEATSVEEALAGTMNSSTKSKNRKSDKNNSDDEQLVPEKKRARRRLIGAIVMVLAVVIGLPMVLDSEPKALNKNIAIQIPSRNDLAIATEPKEKSAEKSADKNAEKNAEKSAEEVVEPEPLEQEANTPSLPSATENTKPIVNDAAVASTPTSKPTTPTPKPAIKESETNNVDESSRALAILNGSGADSGSTSTNLSTKPTTKPSTRIVVQIGAFATQDKVNELRKKLTSAGIKSYTQKIASRSGDKIRVRIGPFDDKESADKVKTQLEKLGLNGTLITL